MKNQSINLNAEYIGNQIQICAFPYSRTPSSVLPLIGLPAEQIYIEQQQENVHHLSHNAALTDEQDHQNIIQPQQLLPIQDEPRVVCINYQVQLSIDKDKLLLLQHLSKYYYRYNICLFILGIVFVIIRIFILAQYLQDWNGGAIVVLPCSGLLLLIFVCTGCYAVDQHKEQQLIYCHIFGFAWLISEIGASVCVFAAFNSQSKDGNNVPSQQKSEENEKMGVGLYILILNSLMLFILLPIVLVLGFVVNVRLVYKIRPIIILLFGKEIYIDGNSN